MQVLWCWRCKANVPMLDDDEWHSVSNIFNSSFAQKSDGRPEALAEYERLTGYRETNFNALFDHRISDQGPPCPRCGKVLRTPVAYKCFECGLQVHEPNWTYLFRLSGDAVVDSDGNIITIVDEKLIERRLSPGNRVEFRDCDRRVCRAIVFSISRLSGPFSVDGKSKLVLRSESPDPKIKKGQDVWLVFRREEMMSPR